MGPTEPQTGNDTSSPVADTLSLLLDEWRWVTAIAAAVLLLAVFYAYAATPIYRTTAMLQIEERESGFGGGDEFAWLSAVAAPTAAEIEILRSRLVLNETIEQENLNLLVSPNHFPIIGGALSRYHDNWGELYSRWRHVGGYAWGGERLQIDRLDTDSSLEDEELTLIAGPGSKYTLIGSDDRRLLHGTVGTPAEASGVELFVSELEARPGTRFTVMKRNQIATLNDLLQRLSITELGQQTGILHLSLEGHDPVQVAATLTSITNVYVRQNVERRSVEAERSLDFLNEQLPSLRAEADAAEQALNRFRIEKGSVDLSLETQGMLEQLTDVERRLSEMELDRVEQSQRFTPQHPAMIALEEQHRELEEVKQALTLQMRALPEAERDALRLTRDVRVASQLYTLLLNRAQELRVVRAGTVGNARIVDEAFVPRDPVKPRKALIVGIGAVLGGLLGLTVVFLRRAMQRRILDPKVLEQLFNLPVYAILPRSRAEAHAAVSRSAKARLISINDPHDPAVESLRSLRTSLEFLFHESPSRVATISSAAPDSGKSFITANLGVLLAQVGRNVLVVDADLRRGHLHRRFGLTRAPGLRELIIGHATIDQAVQTTLQSQLHVLPTGELPPNPAELLNSRQFQLSLSELTSRYEVILIDAPPLMAASEAVHLARQSGVNLLVVRSGRQHPREVELMLNRLTHGGASASGFIFNDLEVESRRYSHAGYSSYRYDRQPESGRS